MPSPKKQIHVVGAVVVRDGRMLLLFDEPLEAALLDYFRPEITG